MKKMRLIVAVVFAVMLCCALAVSASAKWWDDNPFTDVKSTSWYYDAVRICNENGLFEGMTETTFATSTGMTRSMFVTVLAAADESYDASQYTKSSFNDIREGSWYLAPAEWANSIGIANGIGDGAFGPKNTITRQELALMLYKYAQYKGMNTETDTSVDMSAYPDNSTASSWATTALEWSVQNGLISGVASGNETILSPKGTATRAMVAQIMVKYLALDPVYEINGNDLSLYTVVYNVNEVSAEANTGESAQKLVDYIKIATGIELPIVTDETEVSEYEILVGRTNREEKGIVSVDRDAFEEITDFICTVQGNYLIITGNDSYSDDSEERSTLNLTGTYDAVRYFLEEEFNFPFYVAGDEYDVEPDPIISFDDGYTYIDGPEFRQRIVYARSVADTLSSGGVYEDWSVGYPHQLGNLMFGYWKTHEDDQTASENPCFTDPENVESLINNISQLLAEKPTHDIVGLIQNDSNDYCKCDECLLVYREYGSRCGALIKLCNLVCETFEEEYPTVKYATWAYGWSHVPPKEGITLHKNLVVYYNTIALCPSHAYSDSTCKFNKSSAEYIRRWGEAADELYVWDHSGDFVDALTPMPNLDLIRENARYFDDNGVEGVFLNSMNDKIADFNELRAHMFARLYRDPQMSEEEYNYRMNGFLEAYYGPGWSSLRKYIDKINEIGGNKCQNGYHAPTNTFYDYDEIISLIDVIDPYWESALSAAETDEQRENIIVARCGWIYLKQCALHESQYQKGDKATREAYLAENQKLLDTLTEYEVYFGEFQLGEANVILSKSPEDWTA